MRHEHRYLKKLYSFSALLLATISMFAQQDVSNIYINNSGFNTNCNYRVGGTETVGTADPGNIANVNGWTISSSPAWSAAASFEFGWNGRFNGISMPTSGAEGSSGSGEGALGLSSGWGGSVAYSQEITIPAGVYTLEYAMLFQGSTEINANLVAWIPTEGEAIVSNATNVSSTGQWVTNSLNFTLRSETTGTIQVGMQSFQTTSSENARVFLDYVKLISYPADKSNLQTLVNTANELLANWQNVPNGSTAYEELETEVAIAQGILNNVSSSAEIVFNEEEAIEIKIKAVYAAHLQYTLQGATLENPADISEKILNRDFEANGGSTVNWTTGLGIYNGTNAVFNGAPNGNHVMDGDPNASTVGYQTVSNIPAGVYIVKAVARGRAENGASMFICGEAGNVFGSSHRVSVMVNRIGDVGGSLNYGFNRYETPYIILPKGIYDLTLGIYFEGDCGWSSVDNFELLYCGSANLIIDQLKTEVTALLNSVYLPPSYNKTEINSIVYTAFTEENSLTLSEDLKRAITTLENVIEDYTSPELSDIHIDGVPLRSFSPTVENYNYTIYTSSAEVPNTPTITAITKSEYASNPVITNATSIPGRTSIVVTSGNGVKKTYTINFTYQQIPTYFNYSATVENLQNTEMLLTGKGIITITGTSNTLQGSSILLDSPETWLYFPNIRPSAVVAGPLQNIKIFGEDAQEGNNVRVAQYQNGAMVIPHSSTYEPLTVYSGTNLSGESLKIPVARYFKTSELGSMNNNIESFTLERGYMATFASNSDGTGISRVYVADKNSITINVMPDGLSNTASFVVIRPWRWVAKKAWRGSESGALQFNTTSRYDYNNSAYSTLDVEYVPMRHNPGWNSYDNFIDKFSSTHALGYNEPDNSVDDGYSPLADAIEAWPNMMASGLRLGSPAVTDGGLSWLYGFIDECDARNWRVDFVAWHFYRRGYTARGLYDALKSVHDRTGRPLWITEFNNGCNWTYDSNNPVPSIEQNGVTIEAFIQMMDTCSFVERYFVWDGCNEQLRMTNSSNGSLYPAGIAYRDFESTKAFKYDYYNSENIYDTDIIEINPSEVILAEAENYSCSFDGVVESDYTGFSGTGYLNTSNGAGTSVVFKINANVTTTVQMGIGYANGGSTDRAIGILVNGEEVITSLSMPVTGWSNYRNIEVPIKVNEGLNEITLVSNSSDGFANLDYYYFYENVSFIGCGESSQNISLHQGWNLISFNLIPADNSIDALFNGMPIRTIKTMDSFWDASLPEYFNSLHSLTPGEGYLVFMNSPSTLLVSGNPLSTVSSPFGTGRWQLTGTPYQTSTPFSQVLNASNCEIVKDFEGFWTPDGANQSIESFEPGNAYFIR